MPRWLLVLLLVSGLYACASVESQPGSVAAATTDVPCQSPRPMVCTMEYRPVCASLVAGGEKTYPSGCNACADIAVASYTPDACKE